MSKSKRLLELMMTVNRKRKFTALELAEQFQVSKRTILRDLQELSELGVPLYSEVGPHGGYQVLRERILPPIAFTEEEAIAIFFASHALRHYAYLPFKEESAAALNKFYNSMSGEVRDRIDEIKNRIDFVVPKRQAEFPHLAALLEAATEQRVLRIDYASGGRLRDRDIQPIGIYASSGLWYCPAYCFLRGGLRLFRCDRIHGVRPDGSGRVPIDLREVHLGNTADWPNQEPQAASGKDRAFILRAGLSRTGVQRCESELWADRLLKVEKDGTGRLEGEIGPGDISYFSGYLLGLGHEVAIDEPPELLEALKRLVAELAVKYGAGDEL